ncbi:hypothetical protein BGZ60DRAFT_561061 [Tricladium varicosporioides]|nr:hypothetical protein BGZ60DRAFT_561061 [Hymenoscyphus varicosporioides]
MSNIRALDGPDIDIAGPMMRIVWTMYGITIVVVALRFYTQWRITKSLGLGDSMMALSVAFATGILAMLTVQYHYGLGRRFFYLTPQQKIEALKFNFAGQPLGIMAAAFGRNASCILMLQLFGTTNFRARLLWFTFWQSIIVNLLTCILIFVQCRDVRALWDPIGHPSVCWSPLVQEYTGFVQGGINSATDLFLTLLPIRIFWTLNISTKLKFGLGFVLGLSGMQVHSIHHICKYKQAKGCRSAFVASIIKTVELKAIGDRADFTFGTVDFFTWVIVEITLVDIAASVPLILPLFRKWGILSTAPSLPYGPPKPYGGHTIVIVGGAHPHPYQYRSQSQRASPSRLRDPESGLESESAENILPVCLNQGKGDGRRRGGEGEGGIELEYFNGGGGCGRVIVKETTYDVSYEKGTEMQSSGRDTEEERKMWLAKGLSKIPWEEQN